jgi:hypothetical protein
MSQQLSKDSSSTNGSHIGISGGALAYQTVDDAKLRSSLQLHLEHE